jgi:hypothetical protein
VRLASLVVNIEVRQFDPKEGSLEFVHPRVHPDFQVLMLPQRTMVA